MTSLTKASGVLKKYMSMDTLRMVYHALVKNKLQYGIILWGSANKSSLNRLNKLDNKTIRSVTGLPYKTSINKLYHNAGVFMINDLFRLSLAKFMFKLHHKMSSNNAHVENITLVTRVEIRQCAPPRNHLSGLPKKFFYDGDTKERAPKGRCQARGVWGHAPQKILRNLTLF